jgi:tRNA dimethylallyltransferase
MMNKRAVLIAGPTASGKSALALALAEHFGGVVINADSMQVYRELRILTARPSPADEACAPHRLYGTVGAAEPFSVARWLEDLRGILAEERRLPIIVGGTGLYFEALTQGLADIPPIPAALRSEVRALGTDALHDTLSARDPVMAARLEAGDRQRLARALEVVLATGRSLAAWQSEAAAAPLLPLGDVSAFVLSPPRAELYAAIDGRFAAMMTAGAVDEVRALEALGLPADVPILKALGVAPLQALLAGAMAKEDAVKAAQTASRQYAKRQLTWFRNKFMSWKWLETKYSKKTFDQALSFITEMG